MRHLPFPKIPVASRAVVAFNGEWIATEKIHGAQLVIAFDGREFHIGKRKAWLGGEEAFFGWQLLRGQLEQAARTALSLGGSAVRIYGELYGGHYPHADVVPVPGVSAVQTGVWYSPDLRFALFDVLRHEGPDDTGVLLPYADVAAVASSAGLDVVPLLGRGPRHELDALPLRFPTRVPRLLGLPDIPGNHAEGIVMRPDVSAPAQRRPIIKMKIEEFDELRFDESRPWNPHTRLSLDDLRRLAHAMVNKPRLDSARSKTGPGSFHEFVDEVVLDVMVDLTDAFPAAMAALDGAAEDELNAHLRDTVRASCRE
ncbi:Rnl2 family RNA ligase [Thermocatellispora tengchongensis]|uniref:Rnl2 family RNA ligase n=2 Tax=Thermocatellispora tengchongensis TaxID=1073253 RepID=A0A840P338_9ACTN|nr:RNA ligase family protein [Thermocatellispora tengchongensis]MBB5132906.1 Rnl2 family RNA ligase [Thermocatellispora tengchongensis]